MGERIDLRKTEAFREAARARAALQWTPAARAAQGELTRQKMKSPGVSERIAAARADPDVRQRHLTNTRAAMAAPQVRSRISAATKLGMERWRAGLLAVLLETWHRAPKSVRRQFISAISLEPASIEAPKPPTPKPYVVAQICAGSAPELVQVEQPAQPPEFPNG
jgi:hypothetical protein